ncbi:MAG: hypothetical protein Q8O76_04545 [Chloroflexota bacterium]|nr:hypothetical protein [Chloroflexota bacterium]
MKVDWHAVDALPNQGVWLEGQKGDRVALRPEPGRHCDICNAPLPERGLVAVLPTLVVLMFTPVPTKVKGPWALCRRCQKNLGLQEGATSVDPAQLRAYYKTEFLEEIHRGGHGKLAPLFSITILDEAP